MGTSLTNVTAEIVKFRVAPDTGSRSEFYVEEPRAVKHEEVPEHELALFKQMPETLPQVGGALLRERARTHARSRQADASLVSADSRAALVAFS
jgi:hypothetical protein